MNKNIHIKIYPSKEQTIKIEQTLGMNRKVWNSFLNLINERYDNNTSNAITRIRVTLIWNFLLSVLYYNSTR